MESYDSTILNPTNFSFCLCLVQPRVLYLDDVIVILSAPQQVQWYTLHYSPDHPRC